MDQPSSRRAFTGALLTGASALCSSRGLSACATGSGPGRVRTVRKPDALQAALRGLSAGDTVVLQDGRWDGVELLLQGRGRPEAPITLRAETPGRVLMTGVSSLKLLGQHLVVQGLVFTEGHAPRDEVITIGSSRQPGASAHCRVTACSIIDFNPPAGSPKGNWINLHDRSHRVDHCRFEGKARQGPTLAVRLDNGQSDGNAHRIDHNHFGRRPPLGENGAETIKIGSGAQSTQRSATLVEHNLFEACDGELEIISIKSWHNVVRSNIFLRCQGTLTFRQGQENLAEGNVFLGEGVADTGGVRVISVGQTVRHNVFAGLRGTGLRSALSLVNGAPGRTVNSYAPVVRASAEGNTFFDVSAISFGVRASAEWSQAPSRSRFVDNLIVGGPEDLFALHSAIDGIGFSGNVVRGPALPPVAAGFDRQPGAAAPHTGAWGMPVLAPWRGAGSPLLAAPFDRSAIGPGDGAG